MEKHADQALPQGQNNDADVEAEPEAEREPTLEELGLHTHCINCILKRCSVSVEPGVSCPTILCPFRCGAYFHQCKSDDHSTLCPNVKTACLNSSLGCQSMMRRVLCTSHLQHCPAHVVMCGQSMAREDYDNHFCGEHDHQCEPVLGVWREEMSQRMQGTASQEDGAKGTWKKTEENKSENDTSGDAKKKSESETEEAIPTPRDALHTVPWQLNTAEEENEGEEGEPETSDKVVEEPPLSPTPAPTSDDFLQIGSLPFGILQEIALLLDRETLHELALSSHFLRQLAASVLKKKGLVETRWKKVDGKWAEDGRIWRYIPAHLKPDT